MNEKPQREIDNFTHTAVDLAAHGAELALDLIGTTKVARKDDRTLVTEADLTVEDMIIDRLRRTFPDHGILAEESCQRLANDETAREFVWVVDPIDGTRNFAGNIPIFTCSVSLLHHGRPIAAAVAFPAPKRVCYANIHTPTRLNDNVVSVAKRTFSIDSVVATSGSQLQQVPTYLARWAGRQIIRDFGSVAWHLALVAAGQIDAAINLKGKLWDIGAGALLVSQAGGRVLALDNDGQPCGKDLWPIDPAAYRRRAIPLLACSNRAAPGLIEDMAK